MLAWDKLGGGEDCRERKRTNTKEDARMSGDDEAEGKKKKTTEHLQYNQIDQWQTTVYSFLDER